MNDAIAQAHSLIDTANELRLFMPGTSRQSAEAVRLIIEAEAWLKDVKKDLKTLPAADSLALVDLFDLVHRIARQQPADRDFINGIILKAFEARIHGDKTVDEYALYRAISAAVSRRDPAFLGRPLQWLTLTLEAWYNEAAHGYDPTRLSPTDIATRANILLNSDLFPYAGTSQSAFKRTIAATITKN